MAKKKKTYTPAPEVPADIQARYLAVMEVISGQTTVSEAARKMGMSRNHFQTLVHRAQEGMLERLTPGVPGRPAKSEREAELERQLADLRRKATQLEERLEMTDKVMGLAKRLLHGPAPRARATRTKAETPSADDESEPRRVRAARELDGLGLPRALVARELAIPESTLRRWATTAPKPRPPRRLPPPVDVVAAAVADVRELRGLVGAEALRRAHPELSRRQAQVIRARGGRRIGRRAAAPEQRKSARDGDRGERSHAAKLRTKRPSRYSTRTIALSTFTAKGEFA